MKTRLILGIETSCDETAASVVADGVNIASNIIASQVDIHSEYGGIVPEIASRKHIEAIHPVVVEALSQAGVSLEQIDGIAVTQGPGLVGSLVVGLSYAKACATAANKPITGVDHVHAHLMATFLEGSTVPDLPFVGLVVSGGHTSLYLVKDVFHFELLGKTRDDAAGEAFDKVAKILGLPYPGGPVISRLARQGDPKAFSFPRAWLKDTPLDFSFSGLKTAVLQCVRALKKDKGIRELPIADICASFQAAVIDVLVKKTIMAALEKEVKWIVAAGGVASNELLRQKLQEQCAESGLGCAIPEPVLCTDNAAMIAHVGYHQIEAGKLLPLDADVYSRGQYRSSLTSRAGAG